MTMKEKKVPAGFRYTPPSYLHRMTKVENKPWTSSGSDSENHSDDFQIKQEDRPSSRKHGTLDAHFQSRIERRKDLYRGIIRGNYQLEDDHGEDWREDGGGNGQYYDELEHSWSVLGSSEEENSERLSLTTEQARQARQRRILGTVVPAVLASTSGQTKEDSEAARVRNMRAQRLRQAKQLSAEEDSFGERLRLRRLLEQREQERIANEEQERLKEEELYWVEHKRLERERAELAHERRLLEAAQREVAIRQQEQQEQERLRNKDSINRARERPPTPPDIKKAPRKVVRRSKEHRTPPSVAEPSLSEPSLFDEVQLLLRDSGIIKSCVVSCFGDEGDMDDEPATTTRRNRAIRRRRRSRQSSLSSSAAEDDFKNNQHDLELNEESGSSFIPQY